MPYHQIKDTNLEFIPPQTFSFEDGMYRSKIYRCALFFVGTASSGKNDAFNNSTYFISGKKQLCRGPTLPPTQCL